MGRRVSGPTCGTVTCRRQTPPVRRSRAFARGAHAARARATSPSRRAPRDAWPAPICTRDAPPGTDAWICGRSAPVFVSIDGRAATASLALRGLVTVVVSGPSAALSVGRRALATPPPLPSQPHGSPPSPPAGAVTCGAGAGGVVNNATSGDWTTVWGTAGRSPSAATGASPPCPPARTCESPRASASIA